MLALQRFLMANRTADPTAHRDVVALVDGGIVFDKRVRASLVAYPLVEVIDCTSAQVIAGGFNWRAYVRVMHLLCRALLGGATIWELLHRQYGLRAGSLLGGLRVSCSSFILAQRVVAHLSQRMGGVRVIHVHDLFCGIIGTELSRITGAKLIYDAHEVEFHRNRRNSWLRTAFDAIVENAVTDRAHEVRVVSAPILALYASLYRIPPERIRVVPNDHFEVRLQTEAINPPCSGRLALVYVGAGIRGRQLERLAAEASKLGVPVHSFFLGEVPLVAISSGWVIGRGDYADRLAALAASRRCAMWCCIDDVCLSYRLALPNKFFQAISMGIPIIASSRTYLADLVDTYDIGYVFTGSNFEAIVQEMQGAGFAHKLESVRSFRRGLTAGSVNL